MKIKAFNIVSFLWVGSISSAACGFFTQVILANNLDPSSYGVFSSAVASTALLLPLGGFGIAQCWLKAFGEEGISAMRWLPASFLFLGISVFFVLFLLIAWALFGVHDKSSADALFILSFCVFSQPAIELVAAKLQLEERYLILTVWQIIPNLARLILILIMIYCSTVIVDIKSASYIYLIVSLFLFVIGIFVLQRMFKGKFCLKGHSKYNPQNIAVGLSKPNLIQVITQSWPSGLAGLFYLIYFQSNIVIIRYMIGAEAAGTYNVAFTLLIAVYLLPAVIYQKYLASKIHRWANHDKYKFLQSYTEGNRLMLTTGLIVMILILLFASKFVGIFFGNKYQAAVLIIQILAFAIPLRFISSNAGSVLSIKDHEKYKTYIMGLIAVINLFMNFILIKILGLIGAAFSAVITEFLILFLFKIYIKKTIIK